MSSWLIPLPLALWLSHRTQKSSQSSSGGEQGKVAEGKVADRERRQKTTESRGKPADVFDFDEGENIHPHSSLGKRRIKTSEASKKKPKTVASKSSSGGEQGKVADRERHQKTKEPRGKQAEDLDYDSQATTDSLQKEVQTLTDLSRLTCTHRS